MTELPTHLPPFLLSSVTLNARHFKHIYKTESLEILDFTTYYLEALQASCPTVVGKPSVTAQLADWCLPWQRHSPSVPEGGEQGRLCDRNQDEPQSVSTDRCIGTRQV